MVVNGEWREEEEEEEEEEEDQARGPMRQEHTAGAKM